MTLTDKHQTLADPDKICLYFALASSGGPEHPPEGGYAWNPRGRLPVLPAGTFHGPDVHLQGLPFLTPPGPSDHRKKDRPQYHACGESQGEEHLYSYAVTN